ncbi:MAG TPA: tRNA uridine-5-carboxymethylaminomethyl(34) synthesis enzyme MnmG [candidate division Zixibacteria bacterium]|nr:tRNA uridine-5-carboxymethylaminomethyl(34) synthesis enzyme MnmG [candidate division Zixibacteria bacterium]HEQ97786.1 tRNA uridine-5-carboxymethylaminomethyl(34) synthesis enzyme MnmG [candidate division Zixibacteria bacterium]
MTNLHYEIVVAGGGHAGAEAALAASRMGCSTLLVSLRKDTIGQMSCNPAIGGQAKGHLVKEIDALGGEMGLAIDRTGIQYRRLNLSRGPAVHSSRAQADRKLYREYITGAVLNQGNLDFLEDAVVDLEVNGSHVSAAITEGGRKINCRCLIITAGTFLNGLIHIGRKKIPAGRMGEKPSLGLSEKLIALGFKSGRLKTGTPPRLDGKTIDYSRTESQYGDPDFPPFSFRSNSINGNKAICHITFTNQDTHRIILDNLDSSAMYSGQIKGIGPRYCPSIEDKVVRFRDKDRHQIFLEPEGLDTDLIYPNGFPTSLDEEVQKKAIKTVIGLEEVEFTQPGYAIEYDFFFPYQIYTTTETKLIEGLYFSGQVNGTSGYEEAAAQGLMSGINAALKIKNEKPFSLLRSEAYIGVLMDDLTTKSTEEPYRMFTSRAEHRLYLREDNADERLFKYGYKFGLIAEEHYQKFLEESAEQKKHRQSLKRLFIEVKKLPADFLNNGRTKITFEKALKVPGVGIDLLKEYDDALAELSGRILKKIEIEVKYQGYLERQMREIEKFDKLEHERIPDNFDYAFCKGLKTEAAEKLNRLRPATVGQASRISGISPGDITVLTIYLKKFKEGLRVALKEKEH